MSINIRSTYELVKALKAEGFELPEECLDVQFERQEGGAFLVIFRCFMTPQRMKAFGQAIAKIADDRGGVNL